MREGLVDLQVRTEGLPVLLAALRAEQDGKALRRDLAKGLRVALRPAVADAKSAIRSMPATGVTQRPALRPAIARRISARTKLTARVSGAYVRVPKLKTGPRGFRNAPKLTNRKGWRHPVFGSTDRWSEQVGKPGWFDDSMHAGKARYREACVGAMGHMARRISDRSRG